jgi:hypothetical protein
VTRFEEHNGVATVHHGICLLVAQGRTSSLAPRNLRLGGGNRSATLMGHRIGLGTKRALEVVVALCPLIILSTAHCDRREI